MKLIQNLGIALIACFLAIAFNFQSPSIVSATPGDVFATRTTNLGDRSILTDFADRVVIPTYEQLAVKTKSLETAINHLVQTPNPNNLKSAQEAWLAARIPLKQGAGFALGMARSWGLDGTLDTLPIDKTDLGKILNSEISLTPKYISSHRNSLKGFRTIEFLLFGSSSKNASLGHRELAYLQATATVLDRDAQRLLAAWTTGKEGQPAFREVFSTAGEPDNAVYPLVAIAHQEIIEGLLETTEVLEDSIADPFQAQDPKKIDAQYAIASSLPDFHHTLIGVQNAYFGSFNNPVSGMAGLSSFVAQTNPQLNNKVASELQIAIAAVDKIPSPFSLAITDLQSKPKIEQAIAAIGKLKDTLEEEVKPLVL
jgi:putative iron-regulated protein